MPSHLQNFSHHLIGQHGPRRTGHIWMAFTNLGNFVPGADPEEQKSAVKAELANDDRFVFEEAEDRWSHAPAKDETA